MPWKESGLVDERTRFVILAREGVPSFSALCHRFGISRKTGYKWLRRYEETESFALLADRNRRPHSTPNKTAPEIEARVVALRRKYGWGARKLQVLLRREGITVCEATLNRIISRNGLVRDRGVHRPALKRFEHENPNDMWQIDFKGQFRLRDGYCYPLSILDDHSRFLLGLFALESNRATPVIACLQSVFTEYGLPRRILTDHGVPFWSNTSPLGLTRVSVFMMNQGIRPSQGAVRHPQTQGKVERLHRSLQEAFYHHGTPKTRSDACTLFDTFRQDYNHIRPHEALGMDVPAQHYELSTLAFQPKPPAWPYPVEIQIKSLNSQGCLDYAGQRLFVCEALAGQSVGILEADGRLLVQYRDHMIRDIDLATRRGTAFAH